MANTWPKVIRDPVHNLITFEGGEIDDLLFKLINTREFQRLRRIKQLGMSEMVFPGANHSRFAHSLGVMHIAKMMVSQGKFKIDEGQKAAVLCAALLHDIGHGPFSHAFEKVTGDKHESRTLEIIMDTSTEVNKQLKSFDRKLPDRIRVFFGEDIDDHDFQRMDISPILTQIVSSQLDADRADYLLRDSYATGTDYGKFDLAWLLLQQYVDKGKKRLCVGRKAVAAAEAYIFARFRMYQTVYFHKTTRSAEVMLKLLFRRYKSLLAERKREDQKLKLVPNASPLVVKAFSSDKMSLQDYLALDDFAITEFFKNCANSSDAILAELGSGIVNRNLYKGLDVTEMPQEKSNEFVAAVGQELAKRRLNVNYTFVPDTPADTPYKPYDPDEEKPATQIYIETADGKSEEISKRREVLIYLKKRYSLLRYYFPSSQREFIERTKKDILKGG